MHEKPQPIKKVEVKMIGKFTIDILYCVPWGHHGTAAWMVSEFFQAYGGDAAISLTPSDGGRFEVRFNGKKIWDKAEAGGIYPSLTNVREIKATINQAL